MLVAHDAAFREEVVRAVEGGMSQVDAAEQFGVTTTFIRRWLKRYRAGESLEDRPRSGAPPILDEDVVAWLGEMVTADPSTTLAALVDAIEARTGKRVVEVTVRRALVKAGFLRVRPKIQKEGEPPTTTGDRYEPQHRREPVLGKYPSSLTDHEWELLKPVFDPDGPAGRGRPRVHPPRELLDAIFYVLRTGCAWRYLPGDFPPWQTVYAAFRAWSSQDCFERMHERLAADWREREGRAAEPTAVIIDSQSARTTEKGGLEATTAPSG